MGHRRRQGSAGRRRGRFFVRLPAPSTLAALPALARHRYEHTAEPPPAHQGSKVGGTGSGDGALAAAPASSGSTGECNVCLGPLMPPAPRPAAGAAACGGRGRDKAIALRCGHRFCVGCLRRCSAFDLEGCPTCRQPHELDPAVLQARLQAFRTGYRSWRRGQARGARGEVNDVTAPEKK